MLDWKITGGQIVDGSGAAAGFADVGITGNKISALGDLTLLPAAQTVNAVNCIVCPGFIDVHSHSDVFLLVEPSASSKIYQGITTEITGNCGNSAAPVRTGARLPEDWLEQHGTPAWKSVAEYLELLSAARPAVNVAPLVGHGRLRDMVMGYETRSAEPAEIEQMTRLLGECLELGVWGFSSGLIYNPGKWAQAREIEALAATAARYNAIYTSHLRNEAGRLLPALREFLDVAQKAGVRLQISHLKTSGPANWHLLDQALSMIASAQEQGIQVAADRYPYTASCTDLDVILPDWATGGGREEILRRLREPATRKKIEQEILPDDAASHVIIASCGQKQLQGRPLREVARELKMTPAATALMIMESDQLKTSAFFTGMSEDNMRRILTQPYVMPGSDASLRAPQGLLSRDFPHPRAYGTFPRYLRLVMDEALMSLPEAIHKATALPARHFGFSDRGLLAEGQAADVVVFNPATVRDLASFANPHQLATGIEWVFVNGTATLTPTGLSGQRNGKVLRRG